MGMGARRLRSPPRGYSVLFFVSLLILYGVWLCFHEGEIGDGVERVGCSCDGVPENVMWYAPHSGFSNQVGELTNALRVAAILGRTLILPPVTDHHALSLGSCPKYRIVEPEQLRKAALSHFSDLVAQSRYYSIADAVNISAVSPRYVKTMDFRVFALLWCGADVSPACTGPLCRLLTSRLAKGVSFDHCVSKLMQCTACVHGVEESCATTTWTYRKGRSEDQGRRLLALKTKKYSGSGRVKRDIRRSLGSGGSAGKSKVLAFGSLFSAEYQGLQTHVDFTADSGDSDFDRMFRASQYLPLSRVIVEAGKEYVNQVMRRKTFFCAQLRMLDGQFKNHWKKSFDGLKQSLEPLRRGGVTPVFVMTDLPAANWSGTYLNELSKDRSYELYILEEKDKLVTATASRVLSSELGIRSGLVPQGFNDKLTTEDHVTVPEQILPDMLLFLQEAICSCASLGFYGTSGSTIFESITRMRTFV